MGLLSTRLSSIISRAMQWDAINGIWGNKLLGGGPFSTSGRVDGYDDDVPQSPGVDRRLQNNHGHIHSIGRLLLRAARMQP